MVLSLGKVRRVGWARTARSWGRGCGWVKTAQGGGRGCGWGNSSHCWGRRLLAIPSNPAGRTALSCCQERRLACRAKLPLGRAPDWGWDWGPGARGQECPVESAYCSWNALPLTGGCLTNRRMVGRHGMRTPLPPHHHRHRCRHHPQTPLRQKTDAPPVPLSHTTVHHFRLFVQTHKKNSHPLNSIVLH